MAESPASAETGALSARRTDSPDRLRMAIELRGDRLRFPELMDPSAVEELAAQGYEIYPMFCLRRRREIVFDLSLPEGAEFAFVGNFVVHTWFLAAPPNLPRLRFRRDPAGDHLCQVTWSEVDVDADVVERHQRYVELHHSADAFPVPLGVIFKPDPPATDTAPAADPIPAPVGDRGDLARATFRISFREIGGRVRPWFDIFNQELFPRDVEPEPVLIAASRGQILELELDDGEFVPAYGSTPTIRWFGAEGPLPKEPDHVTGIEIVDRNRLVIEWFVPAGETVSGFDVLCQHRGEKIWLDPTIFTKGIGVDPPA